MASTKFHMITIAAIFLPAIVMATPTEYIVGDSSGWTLGYDYQAWAKDKVFRVGDKLVFQYPQGAHNVFKVNGTAFQNCDIPPPDQALTSGNDTVVLKAPGRKWYMCGFPGHCSSGQRLAITVHSYGWAPAPAPTTSSPWAPVPSSPSVPPTPATPIHRAAPPQPWAPAPSPYPWI